LLCFTSLSFFKKKNKKKFPIKMKISKYGNFFIDDVILKKIFLKKNF